MERTQGEERPFLCEDDDLALNQSDEGKCQQQQQQKILKSFTQMQGKGRGGLSDFHFFLF